MASATNPDELEQVIGRFFARHIPRRLTPGQRHLCLDGKTLRVTIPLGSTQGVHLLAVYRPQEGVVLAQVQVSTSGSEVSATPHLLATLDLRGTLVSGDAIFASRSLSHMILQAKGGIEMNILVAGATGVIGRRLIPLLVASGYEVIGTTCTADKSELLQQLGATPQVVDAFDRARLATVVREACPEVIIQQLTDLSAGSSAANARMRREGTRNLVDAAHAAGVRQFIAQSISWVSAPGDGPADEDVPLDLEAPEPRRTTVEGVQALERAVAEMERGLVLRYGTLYGLGTWYAPDRSIAQQVRQGQLTADEGITC